MLTLSEIGKSFGARTLFEDVSLSINLGERIALVGPNGAGKSTLFSIILGTTEPDHGSVVIDKHTTIGYLPQETAAAGDETVLELTCAITEEHGSLMRILSEGARTGKTDSEEYHDALGRYAELGGYQLEPKAKRILAGLAFRESDFHRPAKTMSGGWIMRAHLARLLVMEPDLLMLDEPTNHLDLESLGWFQNYLEYYPGAILMISHDRAFLNALVDNIFEIRNKQVHRYRGNYDAYVEQRRARQEQHLAAYKNQQAEIAKLQEFADRFRAKASKASQAQSKLKQIERMEKLEAPEAADKKIHIKFPQPARSGQRVMTLAKVHFAYGDLKVYRGIDLEIEKGQRTVLVGPNGAGKSTLLKILGGILEIEQGERKPGLNAEIGYYSQSRIDMLNPNRTVLQEAMSIPSPLPEVTTRTILGSFLFSGDDAFKKVNVLSGGEKSRLGLVKLLLNPPNLLLMDEPTTHLDMASIDALIDALKQYQGTLIFISHDVYFIRALAQTVLHISAGKLTPYAGDYDYYLEKSGAGSAKLGLVAGEQLSDSRPPEAAPAAHAPGSPVKSKEQKRKEAEERQAVSIARKQAKAHLDKIEREIAALEQRHKEIVALLEAPETYAQGGDVMKLNRELIENTAKQEELNEAWEDATADVAALSPAPEPALEE
ncbi:MAG TPA: ABC-F family ATP-binding cassette domain-containing protein [Candidatus Methylacidiphilales bacterium]|jgi:ATP-binding cassette subfamily F protein 3|nr:ABC-F family ATP-binding cassette domain-containing protein [Candidatus Methylacidiphilales bacterium]